MMTQCDDTDGENPFLFALLSEEQEERKRAPQKNRWHHKTMAGNQKET